jgi:hypothetical protein
MGGGQYGCPPSPDRYIPAGWLRNRWKADWPRAEVTGPDMIRGRKRRENGKE